MERRDPSELVEEEEDEEMHSSNGEDDEGDEENVDEGGSSSSEEAESGESDSDEGDEVADEVRKKIQDALKANGVDVGEDDSEEDSDKEELMDDEQMMALDDTLANIFRTRTHDRKSKKGSLTFFSPRVMNAQVRVISRGRRPTRSNTLQKQSPRSRGHLCQAGASESSQHSTPHSIGRARDQEQLGRTPVVR